MKTFKQWYNERNDSAKEYIRSLSWVDMNTDDGYKVIEQSHLTFDDIVNSNRSYAVKTRLLGNILAERIAKGELTDEQYEKFLQVADVSDDDDFLPFMDLRHRRLATKVHGYNYPGSKEKPQYNLSQLLFWTEDFDKIDWNMISFGEIRANPILLDMVDPQVVFKYYKDNPRSTEIYGSPLDNELVDKLWFGEDGWTEDEKIKVIRNYPMTEEGVEDFMKRFVTADESNLRYIKIFINWQPSLAAKLYKQKKPQDELDDIQNALGKIPTEAMYRYPKEYRKLFLIAGCCERQNVGKAMAGTIKEVAGLLKMYNWNFDDIFDSLYPQYARQVEYTGDDAY